MCGGEHYLNLSAALECDLLDGTSSGSVQMVQNMEKQWDKVDGDWKNRLPFVRYVICFSWCLCQQKCLKDN
ncbi:hypothetical protein K1719_044957 [Acacia pycnantha]|nr:hypothetical protein K1719_044957 [Acacia pycnantha]